jgi:choline monooxygenase
MDTNVVWPTSATTCDVAFDWWVDKQHAEDSAYIHESLHASDIVQQEDIALCESIQRGVQSVGFRRGRYAPSVETPMFHFHQLLHQHYQGKS